MPGERRGRFCPPPTKAALEEARKKRLKELKMNRILKDTGFYTVFVVIVMFLCFTTRDGLSFHMSQSIRDIFIKNNGAQTTVRFFFFYFFKAILPNAKTCPHVTTSKMSKYKLASPALQDLQLQESRF